MNWQKRIVSFLKDFLQPINGYDDGDDDVVSDKVTEAAFEAILGQLSSLDSLFDSVDDAAIVHSSAPGVATSPTPPRSATHHHHQHTPSNTDPVRGHQTTASSSGQLDGCEDVLRGALLELNTIAANSPSPPLPPGVDSSVSAAATTTSTLQNGHAQLAAPGQCIMGRFVTQSLWWL